MEEEKEALWRQIHMLQDLINNHKTLHGNAPASSRWRNPTQPEHRAQGVFRGGSTQRGGRFNAPQPPQPGNTWRRKYSLVNRTSEVTEQACLDPAATSSVPPWGSSETPAPTGPARTSQAPTKNAGRQKTSRNPSLLSTGSVSAVSATKAPAAGSQNKTQTAKEPEDRGRTCAERAAGPVTAASPPSSLEPKVSWKPAAQVPRSLSLKTPTLTASEAETASPDPPADPPTESASRHHVTSRTVFSASKSTSTAQGPPKTSRAGKAKYTWVANPAKTPPASKKNGPNTKRGPEPERTKSPVKGKKSSPQKPAAPKNRYKWNAERAGQANPSTLSLATDKPASGPGAALKSPGAAGPKTPFRESPHSSYKVKSRTKIIKRRGSSSSPTEKKASPLAPFTMKSRYSLRRRHSPRMKSPPAHRRSSPRALLHISKHKLTRVPPSTQRSPAREGSASPTMKTPASSRLIKTRYRIVKRSSPPSHSPSTLSTLSHSLTWRKRLLLLSRMRQLSPGGRFQSNQQRWRSGGLCVIGGAMYRVSANKLSKAWSPGTAGKPAARAGRIDLGGSSPPSKPATPSRYIASRAVQRSLAIIRQAQQKKPRKEYCMYYNRFGRCNRGDRCPYIHDPEKVAVCTRFLRGTCKKTDGCPFSHKVSKEKMPVCSYFLKGRCHNNDCLYSHVYVSRKAAVCQDFLRGYCPLGEKCKKKHTLLCPDYSRDGNCPKGNKCKLQHRQRKKRVDNAAPQEQTPTTPKKSRLSPGADADGSGTSTGDEEPPGRRGLQNLPAFISLNSSLTPTSHQTPESKTSKTAEDAGKRLQIKPRL
ncbi:zinc finger CCCH domain-containing protein 3 [Spea bombifrons]|uniref:zinc finger CCCH domain-containing protein 3 n=1 Tax=Spea bombifrons TaxID=233779 RepID=UPI00234B9BD1|nr:zinc finger CCCH domain-containing protein 3 [Spea bombifrons]